jgi:hypothetical protein
MTQDELVDLGLLLAAIRRVEDKQDEQKKAMHLMNTELMRMRYRIGKLACVDDNEGPEPDTDPDCPAVLPDSTEMHRKTLLSISEDEPDSVVTREISVHAGPVQFRGPGVIALALLVITSAAMLLTRGWAKIF